MIYYVDTSLIVSAVASEARTEQVQRWLAAADPGTLCGSAWVSTEVSTALAAKLRAGVLQPASRAIALNDYRYLATRVLVMLEIEDRHFAAASRFADSASTPLRAGDALHLAIAGLAGLTLVTCDVDQARAGPGLDVLTLLL